LFQILKSWLREDIDENIFIFGPKICCKQIKNRNSLIHVLIGEAKLVMCITRENRWKNISGMTEP